MTAELYALQVRLLVLAGMSLILQTPVRCKHVHRIKYVGWYGKASDQAGCFVWSVSFIMNGRRFAFEAFKIDRAISTALDSILSGSYLERIV